MCSVHADQVQTPWLSVVGIGLDGWSGVPEPARRALQEAELVVGGARHLALLPNSVRGRRMVWPSPLSQGIDAILARRGTAVAVLASGDPFWYGVGATLARHVPADRMRVWPQPSAFSLAAARMGWALQDVTCLSVHGRRLSRVRPALQDGARLLLLSWDGHTAARLAAWLTAQGFGPSQLSVLAHLGGDAERRVDGHAESWATAETEALNTIAVRCVAAPGTRALGRTPGRPEHLFAHDGQISKREVRAAILALLAPGQNEILWDIGAGSGAIAIEWMLSDRSNRAVAIEARTDRLDRVRANAEALGVPALETVAGRAPDALAGLSTPNAVFIGGGLTEPGLVARCRAALAPGGRIVASSVTVEGDAALAALHADSGGSLRRIAVSRAEPLGGFAGWRALRPITLWCNIDDTDDNA